MKKTFLIFFLFSVVNIANSCTGLQHSAQDGTYVNGRTVEFAVKLPMHGLVIPRGYKFQGSLPDNKVGKTYISKYAVIGGNVFKQPVVIDGFNEKGLTAGAFYFSGYASYSKITDNNATNGLAPTEFVNWILTQFQSVAEVKAGLSEVLIANTPQVEWHGVPPFHYIVYDKSGKSIVIEPIDGRLVVFDNPLGVVTNSPTFDWHLTNLVNYIRLSPQNVSQKEFNGHIFKQFGQGNGLTGLPGDFTPPARFVRAAVYTATSLPSKNANESVFVVFHLLNQFDIPYGAVRSGQQEIDYTQVTTVKDPNNLKYYFKTYQDQNIKSISLTNFDLNSKYLMSVEFESIKQKVEDLSRHAVLLKH